MKAKIEFDFDDMWPDEGSIARTIRDELVYAIKGEIKLNIKKDLKLKNLISKMQKQAVENITKELLKESNESKSK